MAIDGAPSALNGAPSARHPHSESLLKPAGDVGDGAGNQLSLKENTLPQLLSVFVRKDCSDAAPSIIVVEGVADLPRHVDAICVHVRADHKVRQQHVHCASSRSDMRRVMPSGTNSF